MAQDRRYTPVSNNPPFGFMPQPRHGLTIEPGAPLVTPEQLRRVWAKHYGIAAVVIAAIEFPLLAFMFSLELSSPGTAGNPGARALLFGLALLAFVALLFMLLPLGFAAWYAWNNQDRLPQWLPPPVMDKFWSVKVGITWRDIGTNWVLRDAYRKMRGKPPLPLAMPRMLYQRLVDGKETRIRA